MVMFWIKTKASLMFCYLIKKMLLLVTIIIEAGRVDQIGDVCCYE